MMRPSSDEIAKRVRTIAYFARTQLPLGHARHVNIGGPALVAAKRDATRAKAWLRKRGLDYSGSPIVTRDGGAR
jgi:hypothetical protein